MVTSRASQSGRVRVSETLMTFLASCSSSTRLVTGEKRSEQFRLIRLRQIHAAGDTIGTKRPCFSTASAVLHAAAGCVAPDDSAGPAFPPDTGGGLGQFDVHKKHKQAALQRWTTGRRNPGVCHGFAGKIHGHRPVAGPIQLRVAARNSVGTAES